MDRLQYWLAKAEGRFVYKRGDVVEVFFDTNRNGNTFQKYLMHSNVSKMIGLCPGDELKVLNDNHLECAVSFTKIRYHI